MLSRARQAAKDEAREFLEPVLDEDFGIWSSKAVETIQRDVKTQTHAYQSRPRVSKSCHIDDNRNNRMQRMKAETTALRVEHWVGQEVVDIDGHGGEHHEPASLPMSSVSPECHRKRNHNVKREVRDGRCCEHLGWRHASCSSTHLAHAASANLGGDTVGTEGGAGF